jgi:hypothetical protein
MITVLALTLGCLLGLGAPPSAVAAMKDCVKACRKTRHDCIMSARTAFRTDRAACAPLRARRDVKACKAGHRRTFHERSRECRQLFRHTCRPCCRAGRPCDDGDACTGPGTCDGAGSCIAPSVCGDDPEVSRPPEAHGPSRGPSLVTVRGRQLIVRKRRCDGSLDNAEAYVARGVNWSPASKTTATSPADPRNAVVRRPEFGTWAEIDAPLLAAMHVNTVRTPIDPGVDAAHGPIGLAVLDALYAEGIMVIMTVDDGINDLTRVEHAVRFYKDHPAILMWLLGNEWNLNRYFGVAASTSDAAERTETAAALIKTLDPHHPVATSYGDIAIDAPGLRLTDTARYVNTIAPSVDLWLLNIYRGASFGTLFEEWRSITTKPMLIGEFGTDAFETTTSPLSACDTAGMVDEAVQASWALGLWSEIARNLSARSTADVTVGGLVFSWVDEWWKVSPHGRQDCGGFAHGGHPDGFSNEEYYGIVDIDREPRRIYEVLRTAFEVASRP